MHVYSRQQNALVQLTGCFVICQSWEKISAFLLLSGSAHNPVTYVCANSVTYVCAQFCHICLCIIQSHMYSHVSINLYVFESAHIRMRYSHDWSHTEYKAIIKVVSDSEGFFKDAGKTCYVRTYIHTLTWYIHTHTLSQIYNWIQGNNQGVFEITKALSRMFRKTCYIHTYRSYTCTRYIHKTHMHT